MMSRPKLVLTLVLAASLLSACGIKPSKLSPPKGDKEDTFPHVYPNDPNNPNRKDTR